MHPALYFISFHFPPLPIPLFSVPFKGALRPIQEEQCGVTGSRKLATGPTRVQKPKSPGERKRKSSGEGRKGGGGGGKKPRSNNNRLGAPERVLMQVEKNGGRDKKIPHLAFGRFTVDTPKPPPPKAPKGRGRKASDEIHEQELRKEAKKAARMLAKGPRLRPHRHHFHESGEAPTTLALRPSLAHLQSPILSTLHVGSLNFDFYLSPPSTTAAAGANKRALPTTEEINSTIKAQDWTLSPENPHHPRLTPAPLTVPTTAAPAPAPPPPLSEPLTPLPSPEATLRKSHKRLRSSPDDEGADGDEGSGDDEGASDDNLADGDDNGAGSANDSHDDDAAATAASTVSTAANLEGDSECDDDFDDETLQGEEEREAEKVAAAKAEEKRQKAAKVHASDTSVSSHHLKKESEHDTFTLDRLL